MESWLPIIMIIVALVIIIGNLSTFEKTTKQKLRKQGLNERKETLPRSKKSQHTMGTIPSQHGFSGHNRSESKETNQD
ncbi:DUF2897 family protein [Colwellia sp. D2M02]|uniref:DUF2897 domain-containing protein n=1 Tax=Colwellia asteriadis TaxID=517723 RepID=A0ABN1LBX3_9GAMM|nr:DUF2897 family protein [Colwellia sp. D2M02]MBU2892462.1 DUF2897 family protein [Colwellia sp. D2M02]